MTSSEHAIPREPSVVIVGATHPHAGGVAQHNTRLAHVLIEQGERVRIESWKSQYPRGARNGLGTVPRDAPELPPVDDVVEKLAWYSPWSWLSLGWRVRRTPTVVFAVIGPPHAIMYALPLLVLRRRQRVAVVHNVLPHDRSAVDKLLMAWLLRRMRAIIVHSNEQRDLAIELGVEARRIQVTPLPSPGFARPAESIPSPPLLRGEKALTLLFFGMVRHYKGLDVLIAALAQCPDVRLVVAGHFWEPIDHYKSMLRTHGVADRVELRPGYVDAPEIARLFADADALVLPYRSGTASIVTDVAFEHGRAVVVSNVGTLADGVLDAGVGLVVPAEDVDALADALRTLAQPETLRRLTEAVAALPARDTERWSLYTEAFRRAQSA